LDREKLINFLPETIKAVICIWSVLDELDDIHKNIVIDSLIQFTEIIAELIEVEKKVLQFCKHEFKIYIFYI
jgi:hypothetical protein